MFFFERCCNLHPIHVYLLSTLDYLIKKDPRLSTLKIARENVVCHSVLEQIQIKSPYLNQRLPQYESLYPR